MGSFQVFFMLFILSWKDYLRSLEMENSTAQWLEAYRFNLNSLISYNIPPHLTPLNNFLFNLPNPRIIAGKFNQCVFGYVYSNILAVLQSFFVVFWILCLVKISLLKLKSFFWWIKSGSLTRAFLKVAAQHTQLCYLIFAFFRFNFIVFLSSLYMSMHSGMLK